LSGSEVTTIITILIREGGGAKPKARKILLALNWLITSQCPMDPMVAWETKYGEE
jgi:hypothetical protein